MKKLIVLMLICLLCVPAFAEEEAADSIDLFPYIGNSTREEIQAVITEPFFTEQSVSGGKSLYYGESYVDCLCFRYAYKDSTEIHGWDGGTVYYVNVNMSGYSLMGISVGDTIEDTAAICAADGWTEMAEAPAMCDGGYEKTADGVKYTLGYIMESDAISLVYIEAVKTA